MRAAHHRMLAYLAARAGEPSTWRGFVWLLTSFGVAVRPEHAAAIVAVGMAIAGAVQAAVPQSRLYRSHEQK
jgi:hypothetical protein